MSSDSQEERAKRVGEIVRELRQFNGRGASFFRAAASRVGMTDTDMQVIDILDSTGPTTAGGLADLTGLTTGAVTGMLNRLEEAGLVRRERDPNDGRRVIVRLDPDTDKMREISSFLHSLPQAWEELASQYDDEQIAFLLGFLEQSNTISSQEINRLREAPAGEEEIHSAPLGDLASGQFVASGVARLIVRAENATGDLYRARFGGAVPEVKAKDGVVTIRYSKRLWSLGSREYTADVGLSTAIPWRISIKGGAAEIIAQLGGLDLTGLEVKGGMSMIHLELPRPTRVVPIRISGGASEIVVRRPPGVPARVHLTGWVSSFVFDEQTFSSVGNNVRLHSPGFEATAQGYDIEVSSSASMATITTTG